MSKIAELEEIIVSLIKELRNKRNITSNWAKFQKLVEKYLDVILANFSTRWIISILDTYIDYDRSDKAKHAMTISTFMNMLRFAETIKYVRPETDSERIEKTSRRIVRFENGLNTFAIQKQDVFLNLTRRMHQTMKNDPVMLSILKELLRRLREGENVITDFSRNSAVKDRYFPVDSTGLKDNYGL